MKIKIAISPNFGAFNVPEGFETDSTGTKWRIELAEFLIKNATVSEQVGQYDKTKSVTVEEGGYTVTTHTDYILNEETGELEEKVTKVREPLVKDKSDNKDGKDGKDTKVSTPDAPQTKSDKDQTGATVTASSSNSESKAVLPNTGSKESNVAGIIGLALLAFVSLLKKRKA